MNKHHEPTGPATTEQQITLRGPGELADALPYLMGFHPNDSIVLVALHGDRGRFGGRLRLGIPRSPREWRPVAEQLAECLVEGSRQRGSRPDGIVIFLCQDPAEGETAQGVMERLRPLAQRLRRACGALQVPVHEALCLSEGRFWSYCCPDTRCCPPEGNVMAMPGTSVMAATATYAGIQVRGSLKDMEGRLGPLETPAVTGQQKALDTTGEALVPRILDEQGREEVAEETLAMARRLIKRIAQSPQAADWVAADAADDRIISHEEAAQVILGLQDRDTRDRAAEWMEGPDAFAALRLWRALSRRCVGPYAEHAAAPLTLAGWVAWSTGDEPGARVALGAALRADPEYVFARLLHQACNQGLDPETLRQCLRRDRRNRGGRSGPAARRVTGRPDRPRPQRARPGTGGKARRPSATRPGPAESGDHSRAAGRSGQPGTRSGR